MLQVWYNPWIKEKLLQGFELLEWVLPQLDSFIVHHDLRKIVCNVRHTIMWSPQEWREMTPHIRNNWRIYKILLANWNANFVMDDEHEKSRMKKATNELH